MIFVQCHISRAFMQHASSSMIDGSREAYILLQVTSTTLIWHYLKSIDFQNYLINVGCGVKTVYDDGQM